MVKSKNKKKKYKQPVLQNHRNLNNNWFVSNSLRIISVILIILGSIGILYGINNIITNQNENKDNENNIDKESPTEKETTGQINEGISTDESTPIETEKKTTNENQTETNNSEPEYTGLSASGLAKSLATQQKIIEQGRWIATNYDKGDIVSTSKIYTVQKGDTLWEIAEALYGNGFRWTEILNANKNKIRFLPNGEQALIVPGQVLTIQ